MLDYLFELLKEYMELLAKPSEIQRETVRHASRLEPDKQRLWLALADAIDARPLMSFSSSREAEPAPAETASTAQRPPEQTSATGHA